MPSATNIVQTTTPLGVGGEFESSPILTTRATSITGTVFADESGTAFVDQSGDGNNWDYSTSISVSANTGTAINVDLIDQYWRIRYVNGGVAQSTFRLFANPRDPYGAFLQAAQAPSEGGAFGVLQWRPEISNYSFVGRFDGFDELNAITNAAVTTGQNGKYAAFVVADAVVSSENIQRTTEHSPDSF